MIYYRNKRQNKVRIRRGPEGPRHEQWGSPPHGGTQNLLDSSSNDVTMHGKLGQTQDAVQGGYIVEKGGLSLGNQYIHNNPQ